MVAYAPPDNVLIAIGAAFRSEPLTSAAERVLELARADLPRLAPFGASEEDLEGLRGHLDELAGIMGDKRAEKNDTPLQMNELAELMARVRGWLRTLRLIAAINLAADTPALMRVASPAPELLEGYPRDLLEELERRLSAASDLRPRAEEVGLDEAFVGRGRKLAAQLRTAIGREDIDGKNLTVIVRRLYTRKGQVYLRLKRLARAGQVAFTLVPRRAALYHLEEIEPILTEAPPKAVRPDPRAG